MEKTNKHKDTPEKMAAMNSWLHDVEKTLQLEPGQLETIKEPLLDLIKMVAHGPSRPGAPLTAFLVGLASNGDIEHSAQLIARVRELVESKSDQG